MDLTLQTRLARYNQLCRGYDNIYRQAALEAGISFCALLHFIDALRHRSAPDPERHSKNSFYPKQTINSAVMRLQELGYLAPPASGPPENSDHYRGRT